MFKPSLLNKSEIFTVAPPSTSPEAVLLIEQLFDRNNKEFHCFYNVTKFHK